MTGNEFLDRLKRLAVREGKIFNYDPRGRGSHGRITLGDRITTMVDLRRELKKGTLSGMCRDLGIKPNDLYEE